MAKKLTPDEITVRLAGLGSWERRGEFLHRSLEFEDFAAAFDFMVRVARAAEAMDHHPNWSNVYNRVEIDLSTHDAGGITALDFELAEQIDRAVDAH